MTTASGTALEQTFHARWDGDQQATAIVPAERFSQGNLHGAELPYVSISERGEQGRNFTSTSKLAKVTVVAQIVAEDQATAKATLAQIERLFDGVQWSGSGVSVLLSRISGMQEGEATDGTWMIEVSLAIQAQYPN